MVVMLCEIFAVFTVISVKETEANKTAPGMRADGTAHYGDEDISRVKSLLHQCLNKFQRFRIFSVAERNGLVLQLAAILFGILDQKAQ